MLEDLMHSEKDKDAFRFDPNYVLVRKIGEGAYAEVWEATVPETDRTVAIKEIRDVFGCLKSAKCALRELRILRHLQHENIIRVQDVFVTKSQRKFRDVFVASELLESDLYSILKSSQEFAESHVQFFLYQILRGVKYMHSAGVIHRDLKPRNLLVNSNCDLKICDFGLSRVYYDDKDFEIVPLTEFMCTRWYRPPEMLCSRADYTYAVDIWSVGCVLAEMLGRTALFPGHNTHHQLLLITKALGSPLAEDLDAITTPETRPAFESFPKMPSTSFATIYPKATADSLAILQRMLCWIPNHRPTATEALEDPFVEHLHSVDDEPSRDLLPKSDFEFERRKLSDPTLREELFREILHYHTSEEILYTEDKQYSISNCGLLEPGSLPDSWETGESRLIAQHSS